MKPLFLILSGLFFLYLLLPGPTKVEQFSPLPNSYKSQEPGDTTQIPNVAAFFTDLSRKEVTSFYYQNFKEVFSFLGINLPIVKLNYPPQAAHDVIRPYQQSYYLEELVYPLKGSLYINGWEPFDEQGNKRYPFSHPITIGDKPYKAKVTIRYYPAPLWVRLVTWGGVVISTLLLYKLSKKIRSER